jgi:hypothetical protein
MIHFRIISLIQQRFIPGNQKAFFHGSYRIMLLTIPIFLFIFLKVSVSDTNSFKIELPEIPGIEIKLGHSVEIIGARSAVVFQFRDGRIVVGQGKESKWSYDGGHTWKSGPEGPSEKVAIDLGNGEILSISRNTQRRSDGKFAGRQRHSLDNWQSVNKEESVIEIPGVSPTVTGGGDIIDGFLFHHGILLLENGELIATMYGNYEGDVILCDGYPPELNQRKYRTVVVFSQDKGHTWGNPVLVAYDRMLGRGIPDDHPLAEKGLQNELVKPTAIVPAISQEGFREADLEVAPNGDLLCLMRSGGRNGGATTLFPTPLYCSRSADGGKSWSPPEQIADRGVCPNLVTMSNGIIVCTYSRPGNWLIFSDDNGRTWKGAFQFGETRDYNYILEVSPDTIQVYHEAYKGEKKIVRGTFFIVRKK